MQVNGCIKSPHNLPWPAGLAKWRGEGRTGHESRDTAFDQARGAGCPLGRPEFRGFHETRNTAFFRITAFAAVRFSVGARGVASPATAVQTTAPAGNPLFPSSLLFAIVHQKILSCASALAPPGRCFPARCGAVWAAMARHARHIAPEPVSSLPSAVRAGSPW